jgi:hypothetical protein
MVAARIATVAVVAVGWSASVFAQAATPTAPASGAAGSTPGATARPAVPPPTPAVADVAGPSAPAGPIPTADENPAPSDHDAVLGRFGITARHFDPGPLPLALAPGIGCPTSGADTSACQVTMGTLAVRYWWTRNLAFNGGLVFGVGGGRDAMQSLDTHIGVGPTVGISLLLGNWRHLAISASPELAYVWFRPGGTGAGVNTTMIALQAALEAEVHLGFVGVPALSVGLLAGMGLQYESVGETRVWAIGVLGGDSVWGALSNVFVRYYL